MNLVFLKSTDNRPLYINPNYIISVVPDHTNDKGNTCGLVIFGENAIVTVKGGIETVVAKLEDPGP
jgi:hypothetical protein